MKTASAKAKGRKLAQWIKDELLRRFDELRDRDITVTSSGTTGEDVGLSPLASSRIPYQFEAKSHARFAVYDFYAQASNHGDREPAVIIRANRQRALAIIDAEHFFDLVRKTSENNNNSSR